MSYPEMNVAVAHARHEDLIREVNSAGRRMRAELAFDRRVRRASRLAGLRHRVVMALRHRSAAPAEVREVMMIAKAR
jgi:hypothetical protein